MLFEFGSGHYVDGDSWEELLKNYGLRDGKLRMLILLWIGAGRATPPADLANQ